MDGMQPSQRTILPDAQLKPLFSDREEASYTHTPTHIYTLTGALSLLCCS